MLCGAVFSAVKSHLVMIAKVLGAVSEKSEKLCSRVVCLDVLKGLDRSFPIKQSSLPVRHLFYAAPEVIGETKLQCERSDRLGYVGEISVASKCGQVGCQLEAYDWLNAQYVSKYHWQYVFPICVSKYWEFVIRLLQNKLSMW